MSDPKQPLLSLDRRAFLSGAGFAAGAVVATALVPLSIVHAVPARTQIALTPNDPSWNGHIDDAWGHWPPYAHPIPYNVVRAPEGSAVETLAANVHPADYFLITV